MCAWSSLVWGLLPRLGTQSKSTGTTCCGEERRRPYSIFRYARRHSSDRSRGENADLSTYFKRAKLARRFDRFIVYSQVAGSQALWDSGLDIEKAPERYGTLIASAKGGNESIFATSGPLRPPACALPRHSLSSIAYPAPEVGLYRKTTTCRAQFLGQLRVCLF